MVDQAMSLARCSSWTKLCNHNTSVSLPCLTRPVIKWVVI